MSKLDYCNKMNLQFVNYCPFCEFIKTDDTEYSDCDNCPAYGLWGTEKVLDDVYCDTSDLKFKVRKTPFDRYSKSKLNRDIDGVRLAAKEMVELIKRIKV